MDAEVFLDVSGGVHHAGAHPHLYISVRVLFTCLVQYDWLEQREVSIQDLEENINIL